MDRVRVAVERAYELGSRNVLNTTPGAAPARWFAIGDPQTSPQRFFGFLERAGLLGDDGMLAADVGLLSIGDHFDYGLDPTAAARDGLAILRWLVAHPPTQTVLIAGNHDICRVAELAFETDESFQQARALGAEVRSLEKGSPRIVELRAEFHARFPHLPTPEIAGRDFNAFSTAQRDAVQSLLFARRFALAAVGEVNGSTALFIHAGLGPREVAILGVESSAEKLASALNGYLDRAVERVREDWQNHRPAPLDLAPLHIAGSTGAEGGGFLYHRPVNLECTERPDPARPRRFDALTLPRDLLQVVGHTAHRKALEELRPWASDAAKAKENGGIRTLQIGDGEPRYDMGVLPHKAGAATILMIDAAMNDPIVTDYPLLAVANVRVPR